MNAQPQYVNRCGWVAGFGRLWICLATLSLLGAVGQAQETNKVSFLLKGQQLDLVAKQKPKCFRFDAESNDYESVPSKAIFGPDGVCALELVPGKYRFEIMSADQAANRLVAIRTGPVEVKAGMPPFSLPRAEAVQVSAALDGKPLELDQVGVRSLAEAGDARWKRKSASDAPVIFVVPGEVVQVCLVGNTPEVTAAIWKRVNLVTTPQIRLASGECNVARIHGVTPIKSGEGWIEFPDGTVKFPLKDGRQIVTNRRNGLFGYELNAANGQKLTVAKTLTAFSKNTILKVGGGLQPRPWAAVVWKDDNNRYLEWSVALVDADGREVNRSESKIGFKSTIRFRDGQPVPKDELPAEHVKVLQKSVDSLHCEAVWTWSGGGSFKGAPEEFVPVESEHFTIKAPPIWAQKSRNYLGQLERTYASLQKVTGRKGPKKVVVNWRLNTHNAKAQVGGARPWMSMPLNGLRQAEDVLDNPWFMTHEMAHTFGYHHGKVMNDRVDEAGQENQRKRWKHLDESVQ